MKRSRQLAAIMFTDIEGYTTLMQQNEENAIKAREKHRLVFNSVTQKYNGRILQYYGDGTLSIFGSAIDAVNCGIEMQLGFREDPSIPVRIGIHLGDIVFSEDEIIGDGVNVSSRIESLAVAGSVFISDKVYDEIKNQKSIETSFLKTVKLKNIERPIEIYAISNNGLVIPNPNDIKGINETELAQSEKHDHSRPVSSMLLTKLHKPSPDKNLVQRTNLFNKLNDGLRSKLILVSAPAGFGKTTLISDWINETKIPTAWYSLDKNDNDPVEFLGYIITGIQHIDRDFGQNALNLLKAPNKPNNESIASLLINDILNIDQHFLLVLDDFHLIDNKEILGLTTFLLEHIPDNIHIAILTRSDPMLPFARLRSQHQLVEIRSSDLSFTANDIALLFNKRFQFKLSAEDIHSLEKKTEGWIAGLQLAALSMKGYKNTSAFIEAFAGNNRYIMDYLIEEVLKVQSDDIKTFLLNTSVLKQFSASLCNTILDRNDSQLILEKLEKNNMFVFPLDEERQWYRYHHLFADLLKQRLLFDNKETVEGIHNKASDWFEQNAMYDLAIDHALEISNYEKGVRLLGAVVEDMWENGQHSAILRYGEIIPGDQIKKNPEYCLYYGWILISTGKVNLAKQFLESAESITSGKVYNNDTTVSRISYYKKLLGKIYVAFAFLNAHEENTERIFEYGEKALNFLNEEDLIWKSWIYYSNGVAHYSNGDVLKSNSAFKTALDYGKKSGVFYLISITAMRLLENEQLLGHYKAAYKICIDLLEFMKERGFSEIAKMDWTYAGLFSNIGGTHFIWANMDKAQENMKIAYDLSKNSSDIATRVPILMVYSMILHESGNIKESELKMNELEELLKENYISPYFTYSYIGWKIFILIEMNQLDRAERLSEEHDLRYDKEQNHTNEMAYVPYARLLLAKNKLKEAETLLTVLHKAAKEGNRIERLIEIQILFAVFYELNGDKNTAIKYLIDAMELAANEEMFLFFIFDLTYIKELLEEVYKIQATRKTKIPDEFIRKFKLVVDKKEKTNVIQSEDELSARELDTLKLVAEGLMNQEIADKLFISLNTVKTHLKNIFLKLEVNSRTKAVEKAKEMGLI